MYQARKRIFIILVAILELPIFQNLRNISDGCRNNLPVDRSKCEKARGKRRLDGLTHGLKGEWKAKAKAEIRAD